jgi:hypothetical protein
MTDKQQVSQTLLRMSEVFLELSTYEGFIGTLRGLAEKSPEFARMRQNPAGMTFAAGDPNTLSSNFGHLTQRDLQTFIARQGRMDTFTAELVLSYLYQFWEHDTRPELSRLLSRQVDSDVFGDLRIIRNILQHDRTMPIWKADGAAKIKMFLWLQQEHKSFLVGNAYNAIVYAIGLELQKLSKSFGNVTLDITAIPSFFERGTHFGLLGLNKERVARVSRIPWYAEYVLDTSMSNILDLEKEALGDLH